MCSSHSICFHQLAYSWLRTSTHWLLCTLHTLVYMWWHELSNAAPKQTMHNDDILVIKFYQFQLKNQNNTRDSKPFREKMLNHIEMKIKCQWNNVVCMWVFDLKKKYSSNICVMWVRVFRLQHFLLCWFLSKIDTQHACGIQRGNKKITTKRREHSAIWPKWKWYFIEMFVD